MLLSLPRQAGSSHWFKECYAVCWWDSRSREKECARASPTSLITAHSILDRISHHKLNLKNPFSKSGLSPWQQQRHRFASISIFDDRLPATLSDWLMLLTIRFWTCRGITWSLSVSVYGSWQYQQTCSILWLCIGWPQTRHLFFCYHRNSRSRLCHSLTWLFIIDASIFKLYIIYYNFST